jgi:hypothetical protein
MPSQFQTASRGENRNKIEVNIFLMKSCILNLSPLGRGSPIWNLGAFRTMVSMILPCSIPGRAFVLGSGSPEVIAVPDWHCRKKSNRAMRRFDLWPIESIDFARLRNLDMMGFLAMSWIDVNGWLESMPAMRLSD